ncbi:MAG TPA: myxococcus cysteine-rich repeat containing protein [Candidatus Binatia bacterium]|nr:myxococcus cysteine-rich repeat containing protein [Candidatus Binatia bacterium]
MKLHRILSQTSASVVFVGLSALATDGAASDLVGTVVFTGQVTFQAPIPGITLDEIEVTPGTAAEPTGNGEQCEVLAVTSDYADISGVYPEAGTVSAQINLSRGGPTAPDGNCILTLNGQGNDGASISARGTVSVVVTAADIAANGTVAVSDIVLRPSKTQAGLSSDCLKWIKKELKLRNKCNGLLLRLGSAAADKCKHADPEPADCDDGDYVATVLALAHGDNDQQTDPMVAMAVDRELLSDQVSCQKYLGKAAVAFTAVRSKLVQARCVGPVADTQACRDQASQDASAKLSVIDNCSTQQLVDVDSGATVPDLGEPCDSQCISGGELDRRCIKSCFELELSAYTDGMIGDIPECGNSIVQAGEACDDGNLTSMDGCSPTCQLEP